MNKYKESMVKAASWLQEHQNSDGSISPLEAGIGSYYKMPAAFLAVGETDSAWRLLSWIKENVQDQSGDFTGSYERGIYNGVYPYCNAWLTVGAHIAGFFDISLLAIKFLKEIQDDHGGFYTDKELIDKSIKSSGSSYQLNKNETTFDIMCSAMGGLACLYTGNLDAASKTANLLETIFAEQPDMDKGFYFHYQPGQGLFKEFDDNLASSYYIDFSKEKQFYFELGIASVFLTRFGQYINDKRYIDLSERYLLLINRAAQDRFNTPQSGKIGWAASYLYNLTGNEEYKDMARNVANYLVGSQDSSGCWYNVSKEEDLEVTTLDVTAEFVVLLNEMLPALS